MDNLHCGRFKGRVLNGLSTLKNFQKEKQQYRDSPWEQEPACQDMGTTHLELRAIPDNSKNVHLKEEGSGVQEIDRAVKT